MRYAGFHNLLTWTLIRKQFIMQTLLHLFRGNITKSLVIEIYIY